jgi:hypothetical protein
MECVKIIRRLVRPFISVSLVSAVITLAFMDKIDYNQLLGYTGIIVGFHFGQSNAKKQSN